MQDEFPTLSLSRFSFAETMMWILQTKCLYPDSAPLDEIFFFFSGFIDYIQCCNHWIILQHIFCSTSLSTLFWCIIMLTDERATLLRDLFHNGEYGKNRLLPKIDFCGEFVLSCDATRFDGKIFELSKSLLFECNWETAREEWECWRLLLLSEVEEGVWL